MNSSELRDLLERICHVSIGILGDFCLDAYLFLDPAASEISLETGLPTRMVRRQRYSPGGAGNVAHNVCALGVQDVAAFGVIGDDPFGHEMTRLLQSLGSDTSGLLVQPEQWDTHVYMKPYQNDQEQNRIDFGNFNVLSSETCTALIQQLERRLPHLDLVIINQQVLQGVHTAELHTRLRDVIQRSPDVPFITDSRHYCDDADGTIRKLNDHEGAVLCGLPQRPDEPITQPEARRVAHTLYERWQQPVVLTRREQGCLVYDQQGFHDIPGLHITAPTDTVGAGDSMLAGIAAALAAGADLVTAAEFGNLVAGVTVQKLFQTGTASPKEILALGTAAEYQPSF